MPRRFSEPIERCGTTCLGDCCKTIPGICSPKDIKEMFPADTLEQSVVVAINTGNFSIDWYEDDLPLYYVRPATIEGRGMIRDPSWGGCCVFLTDKGCSLPKRPYSCKALRAGKRTCTSTIPINEKIFMGNMWEKVIDLGSINFNLKVTQKPVPFEIPETRLIING